MKNSKVTKPGGHDTTIKDTYENRLQQDCFIWFHNSMPSLRGLLCYNLNNSVNYISGAQNKTMGLQAGRSDLVFYYKGKAHMIELKTVTGTQKEVQKEWQKIIESQGFDYYIIRTLSDFTELIKKIINNE